ncbi:MAG: gliding motility lipoprotein GldD [Bacteroidetes bacterium]|nr:gliding motility lipoprotein GldD [Bacteroidota bacterium]
MIRKLYILIALSLMLIFLFACTSSEYQPKPKAYFRIDFPEKEYRMLDSAYPYKFEIPSYTFISPDHHSPDEKYWINLNFPEYNGQLHLSYKPVEKNLVKFMEDSRTMAYKHIPKASSIETRVIINPEDNVYGLIYEINGMGAASPYQFFVTDSSSHFLRGALYFNITPNNDSLAPVIDFIKEDIEHLILSLRWK